MNGSFHSGIGALQLCSHSSSSDRVFARTVLLADENGGRKNVTGDDESSDDSREWLEEDELFQWEV